jgi:hypothetical protein
MERKRWAPIVATGQVPCARCRLLIRPGEKWHLDHREDRLGWLRPSHAYCNEKAGAERSNAIQRARKTPRIQSREW